MIPTDLVEFLRCPQSGQELALAGPELLDPLNDQIARSSSAGQGVRNFAGTALMEPLTAALLRSDRLVLYPVRDGIPVLLADEAIRL